MSCSLDALNVTEPVNFDNSITSVELHSHKPFTSSNFSYNDEIRIGVNQKNVLLLPGASSLYIEGAIDNATDEYVPDFNCILNIFEEIRLELNSQEISRCRNVGLVSTVRALLSVTPDTQNAYTTSMMQFKNLPPTKFETIPGVLSKESKTFAVLIPLRFVLGFAADYQKVLLSTRLELILLRGKNDSNCFYLNAKEGATEEDIKKIKIPQIRVTNISWRMPHVKIADASKIRLYGLIKKGQKLPLAFREWDCYEYPALPTNSTSHSWSLKTVVNSESPHYCILFLQQNRKDNWRKSASIFDHSHVQEVKLFLNSTYYPYENLNLDFDKHKVAQLYEMFCRFQESYFNIQGGSRTIISLEQFLSSATLFVIDVSRQEEDLKPLSPVDIRIDIRCSANIPEHTAAYAILISDRVFEYSPLEETVKRLV
jgi:hypothetical protein